MRGDGTTWALVEGPDGLMGVDAGGGGPSPPMDVSMWVAGPANVLVGTNTSETYLWDGTRWTMYGTGDNRNVSSMWGYGPDDIWGARGDAQYIGHWTGQGWQHLDSVHGGILAGGAPGDWWGASSFPTGASTGYGFQHHRPSGMYDNPVPLSSLGCSDASYLDTAFEFGWASATDDVWFVGDGTFHFDGARWRCVPTPVHVQFHGVWGTSRKDVWAVGDAGTLLHFDGAAWSAISVPTTNPLLGVWASGPCDVWAVGDAVYHGAPP
jgi:hypothetical protein